MKTLLLLLLVLRGTCSLAQRLPDYGLNRTRITEPDGRSTLIETRPVKGPRTDERKTYYWYSANRVHTTQGGYSGKLLNGPYQQYDGSRNLRERGTFSRGLKSGTWKTWNDAGRLAEETRWKHGHKQGAFRRYDDQGKLIRAGHYKNDQVSGKVLVYYGADSVRTIRYKAGRELPGATGPARASFFGRLWPFGRKGLKRDTAEHRAKGIDVNVPHSPAPMMPPPGSTTGINAPVSEKEKKQKKIKVKKYRLESSTPVPPVNQQSKYLLMARPGRP